MQGSSIASPTTDESLDGHQSGGFFAAEQNVILEPVPSSDEIYNDQREGQYNDGLAEGTNGQDNEVELFGSSWEAHGLSGNGSDIFVNTVYQKTHMQEGAALISYPNPGTAMMAVKGDTDCETAGDRICCGANEINSNMPLPAQTVAALSENLPWDPEGDITSGYHNANGIIPINIGQDIPIVREQLLPDVKPRREMGRETWNRTDSDDKMYENSPRRALETKPRVDRLSPDVAEMNANGLPEDGNASCFDRRKRRTIRRIDWGTNYIPPLDFAEPKTFPKPQLQVPMQMKVVTRHIGKETSV